MAWWLQRYAFDVIGEITYSKRFGFMDRGEDAAGMIGALDASMRHSTLVGLYDRIHPCLYKVMQYVPGAGAAGRSHLMAYIEKSVDERKMERKARGAEGEARADVVMEESAPRDFLDRVMDMLEAGRKGVIPSHLFTLCMTSISAGNDTTAVSLSSVLYHLIKMPNAVRKLREELRRGDEEGKVGKSEISFSGSMEMRYLQACLKEGLRMLAATGLPLWRTVPEGGATICGQFLPAGEGIGINTWVAHYNRNVWGEDVDMFRPERWIEAEDEGGVRSREWRPITCQ